MCVANKEKITEMAVNMSGMDAVDGRSLWADARRRFMHNKAAVVSLIVLALIVLFSIIGPSIAVWSNEEIDWSAMGSAATMGRPSIASRSEERRAGKECRSRGSPDH